MIHEHPALPPQATYKTDALTLEIMHETAQKYFNLANYVQVSLLPEGEKWEESAK
jgi:predicted Zn-dependent peptidase